MTILTAEEKAQRKVQHSRNQAEFREAVTPEVKQEVKMRDAQTKTQRMAQETAEQKTQRQA